jgi:hypothetical protein
MLPPESTGVAGVKLKTIDSERPAQLNIPNDGFETRPKICPEATELEVFGSEEVCTLIPEAEVVAAPIVKPLMVMVKGSASMVAPIVVITIEDAVVRLLQALKFAMLLAPTATLGNTDEAKNPAG